MSYFTDYYSNYFDVGAEVAVATAFYGGHFGDPNQPFHFLKRHAYDRKELRRELEAVFYPKPIPGRTPVKQPEQPKTPLIEVIREVSPRYVKPIYIPDVEPELRRLFRVAVRGAIAKRVAKKKKRRRDEEALLMLYG